MFKNVRGPITEYVLTYVHGKMPGGFTDIHVVVTTACTQKLVYHTRTGPTRKFLTDLGSLNMTQNKLLKVKKKILSIVAENDHVRNDCIETYKYGTTEYWYDKKFFLG